MSSIINQINDDKNYKYEKTKTTFGLLIALIYLLILSSQIYNFCGFK